MYASHGFALIYGGFEVAKDKKRKRPKGSDSTRKVLQHASRGIQLLSEYNPRLMGKTQMFMAEAMKPNALSRKQKELITLGMAITQQCHYCIALHIRSCKANGVTVEEIIDVCGLAILMGGGPALTHMAEVERCLNEHYLDEEGDPV